MKNYKMHTSSSLSSTSITSSSRRRFASSISSGDARLFSLWMRIAAMQTCSESHDFACCSIASSLAPSPLCKKCKTMTKYNVCKKCVTKCNSRRKVKILNLESKSGIYLSCPIARIGDKPALPLRKSRHLQRKSITKCNTCSGGRGEHVFWCRG